MRLAQSYTCLPSNIGHQLENGMEAYCEESFHLLWLQLWPRLWRLQGYVSSTRSRPSVSYASPRRPAGGAIQLRLLHVRQQEVEVIRLTQTFPHEGQEPLHAPDCVTGPAFRVHLVHEGLERQLVTLVRSMNACAVFEGFWWSIQLREQR